MNMIPLAKLKKLARGAIDGPWVRLKSGHVYAGNARVAECPPCAGHRGERNAKFIAAADPAVVLHLINRIEQLEFTPARFVSDLCLRFDREGDELLKSDNPDEQARGRNRKIAATSLGVEANRLLDELEEGAE